MRSCILVCLCWCLCGIAGAAIPLGGSLDDDIVSLIYDPTDGRLVFEGAGRLVSVLEIVSSASLFTGPDSGCQNLPSPSRLLCEDLWHPRKQFFLVTGGLSGLDYGRVLPTNLSADTLASDLTVNGAFLPSGAVNPVDLIVVPEPSTSCLAGAIVVGATVVLRRRLDVKRLSIG